MLKISRINLFTSFKFYLKILIGFFFNDRENFLNSIKKLYNKNNFLLLSQGRVALHSCLKYEISRSNRKEIIISPYTLPEVLNVITNLNMKPIFVDLDIKTGLPKIEDLKKKISKKTMGVLITHLYSSQNDIKKFINFTKKNSLCLIEDCAINFGSKIKIKNKYKMIGTLGDYGFFSFGMMKNICLFNGGALYVRDKNKYYQIKDNIKKKIKYPFLRFINLFLFSIIINIIFSKFFYNLFTFRILKYSYYKNNFLIKKIYPGLYPYLSKYTPKSYDYDFCSFLGTAGVYQINNFKLKHLGRVKKIKYYNYFLKGIKNINLLEYNNYYENSFLEYPIILKKFKNTFVHEKLLENGFDIRKKWYLNCNNIKKFRNNSFKSKNIDVVDNYIICLPLHDKINKEYIKNISLLLSRILDGN